jgi:hypothetical protein
MNIIRAFEWYAVKMSTHLERSFQQLRKPDCRWLNATLDLCFNVGRWYIIKLNTFLSAEMAAKSFMRSDRCWVDGGMMGAGFGFS